LQPVGEPLLLASSESLSVLAVVSGEETVGVLLQDTVGVDVSPEYVVYDRALGTQVGFHSLGSVEYFSMWRDELLVERLVDRWGGCGATTTREICKGAGPWQTVPGFGGYFDEDWRSEYYIGTLHTTVFDESTIFSLDERFWECGMETDHVSATEYFSSEPRRASGVFHPPGTPIASPARLQLVPLRGNALVVGAGIGARLADGSTVFCARDRMCAREITPEGETLRMDPIGRASASEVVAVNGDTVLVFYADRPDEDARSIHTIELPSGAAAVEHPVTRLAGREYRDWANKAAGAAAGEGFALLVARPGPGEPGTTARLLLFDRTGAEIATLDLPQIPVPDAEWARPRHVVTAGLAATDRCVDLAWADTMLAAGGAGPDSSELWRQSFCCME
jgi:hypothetical protein